MSKYWKKPRPLSSQSPYLSVYDKGGRVKKDIGGVLKKIISTVTKPKGVFKPKPKEVDVDKLLKNLGDEIKAQPIPDRIRKKIKELQKAYPSGKLKK